jgi:hypothetical protein
MQILVLGMHRSGTSMVARLLNMMGAYFATEGTSIGANQENPKGFWERRDVWALNDTVLHSAGANWHRVGDFTLEKIPTAALAQFKTDAGKIILDMDAHRPWFLKDPRFCLLAPLWLDLLEVPRNRQSLAFGSGKVARCAKWISASFWSRPLGTLQHCGIERHTWPAPDSG